MLELYEIFAIMAATAVLSGGVMLFLAFYTWRKYWVKSRQQTARTLVFLLLLEIFWVFAFALEIIIDNPYFYYFLERFAYIGVVLIGPTWLVFALQWTGKDKWLTSKKLSIMYAPPLLFLFLIFTNDLHGLIFYKVDFFTQGSSVFIKYEYSELWWLLTVYCYFLVLIGVYILTKELISLRRIYRKQAIILLTGTIAPWIGNMVYNLYLTPFLFNLDPTPSFFVISGLAYVWGFSKLKLIEALPIARDIVFKNMSDPVVVLDNQDRIVDINPVALNIFGCKDLRAIGKKFEEAFSDQRDLIGYIQNKKDAQAEISLNLDGDKRYFDMKINSIYSIKNDRKGHILSLRDITERKKAEEEIEKNAEQLRMMNEELKATQEELNILNKELERKVAERTAEIEKLLKHKEEFIAHLGHDIKSPLTPLIGLLPIIEEQEQDPKLKELLEVSMRNVNYMKDLVVKTLQIERLNSPNTVFNIEDANLLDITNNVIGNKQYVFNEKNINIENNIAKEILAKADSVQIKEVFDNLLMNAVKFTKDGGKIIINAEEKDSILTVSVRDTGIGMTKDQIEHIFEEFYKVDPARHDLDSSGLGLSICKRIVEKHGGKIWVESPGLGEGSTFYFTLPKK